MIDDKFKKVEYTLMDESDLNERIGHRVRQLRIDNHISQEAMAEEIGKSTRMYQNYENGNAPFPDNAKVLIAEKFEITMDELFFGDGGKFEILVERNMNKFSDSRLAMIGRLQAIEVGNRLMDRKESDS